MASATPPDRPAASSPVHETVLVAVLLVTMLVSTLPQYTLGVLAPVLTVDLLVGEAALGAVASSMYLLAAVVARGAGGRFDGARGRQALSLLYATTIAALVLMSISRSVWWLLPAAAAAGIGMGLNNPITNRIVAVAVTPRRRGAAIGVKQTGVKLSQLAAGAAVPWLISVVGWRRALLVLAGAAATGLLLMVLVTPGEAEPARSPKGPAAPELVAQMRWLRRFAASMAIGMSAVTTYLPLYAVQRVEMSLTEAGLIVSAFAVTGSIARLFWAAIAGRLGNPTLALLLLSGGGAAGLGVVAAAAWLGPPVLWVGALITGLTAGSWNAVVQVTVVREVAADRAAGASGVVQSAFLLGLAAGAPTFGAVVELTGSFTSAWCTTVVLALAAFAVADRERRRRASLVRS